MMNLAKLTKTLFVLFLVLGMLAALLPAGVFSLEPESTPRPTVVPPTPRPGDPTPIPPTPTPVLPVTATPNTNPQPADDDGGEGGVVNGDNCAAVYGTAINWGFGNQSGAALNLSDGGWQQTRVTGNDGTYNFGGLGNGVGILTVSAPGLQPVVNQAAIRLTCQFPIQANMGFYSSAEAPQPPAYVRFASDSIALQPGETATVQIDITNDLPTGISQVVLTDLLPEGLSIEAVNTTLGSPELLNGRMMTLFIGTMSSGQTGSVELTVRADAGLAEGASLENRVTLFYAESIASQDVLSVNIGEPEAVTISETAPSTDTVETEAVAEADSADSASQAMTDTTTSEASGADSLQASTRPDTESDDPPPPDVLPVTGVGVSLSLFGLVFSIFALLARGLRAVNRQ